MNGFLFYEEVVKMRRIMIADVDHSGCHTHSKDGGDFYKFTILISLILSSRSKDLEVKKAMDSFLQRFDEKSIGQIHQTPDDEMKKILNSGICFLDKKVQYVKDTSKIIHESGIPETRKGILALPGIGPKSADLYFSKISDTDINVAIDTHLDRIFKRWKWVPETNTIRQTSIDIGEKVPNELKKDMNQIVVGFGQMICSKTPKCEMCILSNKCPSSSSNKTLDIEEFGKLLVRDQKKISNTEWTVPENGKIVKLKTLW